MAAHYSSLQVRQALRLLGFSENEVKVMTSLFHLKKASAKEISRQSAVTMSSVQYALANLTLRGLVRQSKTGDTYEICPEQELFDWIDEQKVKMDETYDEVKNEIHTFLSAVQNASWKPEVMYFEGREGVVEIYEDMLETGKDIYCWTDIKKIEETLGEKYMKEFIQKRIEKKVTTHALMPKNPQNILYSKNDQKRETKLLDKFLIQGEIRIYGDKVAVITSHEKPPVGFIFQGRLITELFKSIFQNDWERN